MAEKNYKYNYEPIRSLNIAADKARIWKSDRKPEGMTYSKLSEILNISKRAIDNLLCYRKDKILLGDLARLADAMGFKMKIIFTRKTK